MSTPHDVIAAVGGVGINLPTAVLDAIATRNALHAIENQAMPPAPQLRTDLNNIDDDIDTYVKAKVAHDKKVADIEARRLAAVDLAPHAQARIDGAVYNAVPDLIDEVVDAFNEAWSDSRAPDQIDRLFKARILLGEMAGEDIIGNGFTRANQNRSLLIVDVAGEVALPGNLLDALNYWGSLDLGPALRWTVNLQALDGLPIRMTDTAGLQDRRAAVDEWRSQPQGRQVADQRSPYHPQDRQSYTRAFEQSIARQRSDAGAEPTDDEAA